MSMKLPLTVLAATLLLPVISSAQTTGTSHPEALNDDLNASPQDAAPAAVPAPGASHYVKPSPAVPAAPSSLQPRPGDPSGVSRAYAADDPNSGMVLDVPTGPNELPIGTRLKAYLQTPISTSVTPQGAPFIAAIQSDVLRDGRVLIPAGTFINGRISLIHGGRRITGAAAIRMQPEAMVLPDGTLVRLEAEVVDVAHFADAHVNREGTIVANSHAKTAAIVGGATTATAVVAGAMIGGGVGAVVGLAIGAGAGTVLWLRQDRQQTLAEGTEIVFALNAPLNLAPAAH